MNTTQKVWAKQHTTICQQITDAGAVRTIEDDYGTFTYVDESAISSALAGLYRRSVEVGAAKGWL